MQTWIYVLETRADNQILLKKLHPISDTSKLLQFLCLASSAALETKPLSPEAKCLYCRFII